MRSTCVCWLVELRGASTKIHKALRTMGYVAGSGTGCLTLMSHLPAKRRLCKSGEPSE